MKDTIIRVNMVLLAPSLISYQDIFLVHTNLLSAYVLWKTTSSSTYLEQQTYSEGLNLYISCCWRPYI